ncbi:MAG: glycine--tRNA ligase [Candidatus Kerfeldbacteria bacterium RIFOXYA2_FULL_38_24]|uniref:Glycine--tRNA ligase n=1 Tax=Candidatus Kerfeldbacteria bacterium RIFOXYB2_FULL_38_14 TaxID=1798547 RepID=A0A1G2B9U8_9BACT|nr:MAG: glycine--tRNA ligase [Candidatus Kerfeldbacteria bacterium RIFOXYA2_FULL_38_24]OGY85998.1 MAG: glycine--tRNA ligase [Candidatus Kerfeldbacteria bacterium RIFOXYB2_FULL_38_14]OGY90110.1 MAG: glycine--tRNA ligase [Candidatus Kerfeldbacteria bacterium RIFOXYC2_FULL_38_9]
MPNNSDINSKIMENIIALCKRRGFVYPSSEIYGGFSATYDYGPYGVELLKNIKDNWWNFMVRHRSDVLGLDTAIFMNPKVWEASGHTTHFTDPLMDCKNCKARVRADKLVEEALRTTKKDFKTVDFSSKTAVRQAIDDLMVACPQCGKKDWTEIRDFNTLFETYQGVVKGQQDIIYLRGEIAQGMFVQYKNILNSTRARIPFGIAQSGKAFRNEVTVQRFIFRTREFNLAEIEYFVKPKEAPEKLEFWKKTLFDWHTKNLGVAENHLHWREQTPDERAHYSNGTFDLEYQFPWGFDEVGAVANRTDYDLKNHQEKSGVNLTYTDPVTQENYLPFVIEPTFGLDRTFLEILCDAYQEETTANGQRTVLKLHKNIAPIQLAVFPLLRNKPDLVSLAQKIFAQLKEKFVCEFDDNGNVGKRYRRQDEIGTPYCLTVDFDSLTDQTVTVRDRDTMQQTRMAVSQLEDFFNKQFI